MNAMIASLLRPEAYHHPVEPPQLIETHISWVLLTGRYAYKIKKPVDLGFVDFSTLGKRRLSCEEEVRLNCRLAPELYLGVVPVFGPPPEARFHGSGEPVEWAVHMRQFPQDDLLAHALAAGRLTDLHWQGFADALAEFHQQAAIAPPGGSLGTPDAIRAQAMANFGPLDACSDVAVAAATLRAWMESTGLQLAADFQDRLAGGWVREAHGDLHLGNMILLGDRITAFDCLEFNPELRWIDLISELAFFHMDLAEHGRPLEASRVLNRWLDRTGDYPGLRLWRWYVVYRALVRAKIAVMRRSQTEPDAPESRRHEDEAQQYLAFATEVAGRPPGRLIVMHGRSGSGKSHVARHLCHHLGWIHLRSDAERKRLHGLWGAGFGAASPAPADLYSEATTERLFREIMTAHAGTALRAGFTVMADATFLKHRHRAAMAALAAQCGAAHHIIDCQAPESVALDRLQRRAATGGDPSDADADVYRRQAETADPLDETERAHAIPAGSEADLDSLVRRFQ